MYQRWPAIVFGEQHYGLKIRTCFSDRAKYSPNIHLQYLVAVGLDELGVHVLVLRDGRVDVLLEVHGEELEDEVEPVLLHDDVPQAHDVGVLELLEQGDLPDGG